MPGAHVLLFEPDPETRLVVAEALRRAGHGVTEAGARDAAIELIGAGGFEMIVAAVGPAAREAPIVSGGSGVVLFLVEREHLAAIHPLLAAPLTDFLLKPIDRESLEARLAVAARLIDISERRAAADSLRRSEERFMTLYSESPIGILLYDHAGQPVEMNPACRRIFGVESLAQIPNMFDCFRIFPEPSVGERATAQLSQGETFRYEFPVSFERGTNELSLPRTSRSGTIYVDLLMTPLAATQGGRSGGYLVQVQDVTDRRLAEQSLELAYQDMRKVLDSVPECVAVHRDGRLLYVNAEGLALFGHASLREVTGEPLLGFLRPVDPEAAGRCLDEMQSAGSAAITREMRVMSARGEVVLLEVTGGPRIEYEGGLAALVLARDVSEKKRLESRLVVADRMASLGTLAAGVAHEINNPLSYVMANVSHVSSELAGRASASTDGTTELAEALSEALVGVDRIRRIVADLKTFSRPEDERPGVVDVRRVLDSSVNMATNEVRHRARLIKEYSPVPLVRGSEARLGQVFLNLLVNAAQAMPVGQASANEIRLRTREGADGRAIIEVADTGPGIGEDVLGRIFDPFFTTKPVGEGTGLGLAICHAIVKALGGEISVDSVVGEGTTVRVALPAAAPTEDAALGRSLREPAAPRRRILVIDDERLFAAAVRRMLQSEHEVTLVESGRDAIGMMEDRDFDVVLCDLMMPEVTGMDVFNEVRRSRPGYEDRMVFMTGGAFTPAARQFLESVPNVRLDKPFTKEEVRAAVRRLTTGERRGSENRS